MTFGSKDGKGGFFPNGVNGRINLPTPLTPVYGSTRPGTVFPAFDQTGFADPCTADEHLGEIPFLPRPPTSSESPAPDVGIQPEQKFDEYLTEEGVPSKRARAPEREREQKGKRVEAPALGRKKEKKQNP